MKCKLFRVIVFMFVIIYSRPNSFEEKTCAEPVPLLVINFCVCLCFWIFCLCICLYIIVCIVFLVIRSFSEEETISRPGLLMVIILCLSFSICICLSICVCICICVCNCALSEEETIARPGLLMVICPHCVPTTTGRFANSRNKKMILCATVEPTRQPTDVCSSLGRWQILATVKIVLKGLGIHSNMQGVRKKID